MRRRGRQTGPDNDREKRGARGKSQSPPASRPWCVPVAHFWGTDFYTHQCWEVLPFCRFQRQRCIKSRVLRAQDFYTPLALKTAKGQHLPALVVYKNQSPIFFLQENACFCRKVPFSFGKGIFLQENPSFCSLLSGVKTHAW